MRGWWTSVSLIWTFCAVVAHGAETGVVRITIEDEDARPLPCRIHLLDGAGKFPKLASSPYPHWRDHFVCPGSAKLELPTGEYTLAIERGPEYERLEGKFICRPMGETEMTFRLKRIANLAEQGWFSGDLHVHRPFRDVELLMRAEDLHVAPVITWWNDRNVWAGQTPSAQPLVRFDGNRYYHRLAGEDEREGGALLFFNLQQPLQIAGATREYPSPMRYVTEARKHDGVWIDAEKPFWWDVPVWLANGAVDSIGLANNHMCHSSMYETEAWGRPRDTDRLPAPRGNGYWSQEIYYHILNCGIRLPPSAGSASGVLPNPVGYNRVYVYTGADFDYASWWKGLQAGRAFVTNGPLLLADADEKRPGHVFTADGPIEIKLAATLTSNDRVPAIEIIKNGRVESTFAVDSTSHSGSVGTIQFKRSGWFLLRAVTDEQRTFRFASTAPFYVEIGPTRRRISRQSAQFFVDWVAERIERVPKKLGDPSKLDEVLEPHREAQAFWQDMLNRANAD